MEAPASQSCFEAGGEHVSQVPRTAPDAHRLQTPGLGGLNSPHLAVGSWADCVFSTIIFCVLAARTDSGWPHP